MITFTSTGNDFVERQLYWLLPDDLLPERLKKERPSDQQGWPQTVPLIVDGIETLGMTETIQRFLYSLNPGLPPTSFADLFDTWNTGNKVRDSANYITGERTNEQPPKLRMNLTLACNVVMGEEMIWPGGVGVPAGTEVIKLVTLHPDSLPDGISYPGNEHVIHHLTIIGRRMVGSRQMVNPFPQNGGGRSFLGRPCFTALIANKAVYIQKARTLKLLPESTVPNPYWPVWVW